MKKNVFVIILTLVFTMLINDLDGSAIINCDHPSHVYRVGETAVFTLHAENSGTWNVEISSDGEAVLHKFQTTAPGTFGFTLPHPGFLRVKAADVNGNTAETAVAFDPLQILPVLPEPEDFDAFWQSIFAQQKSVPENFKMTELPALTTGEYSFYAVQCDNINGKKVYGYLRLPRGKGPFPLLIYVEGYGRGQNLEIFQEHCQNVSRYCTGKVAALTISVHAFSPPESDAEYKKFFAEYLEKCPGGNYWLPGLDGDDMSKTFFVQAISGAVRLCNLVCALPVIDQKRITCYGVSQGGAFGIYLTANCPQIKALFAGVPAFGDCGGFLLGRHTPQSNNHAFRQHYAKLRYFDTVNFARRIKVPVYMSAGFIDPICPPSSVYAIYNQLQGNKMFYDKTRNAHNDGSAEYNQSTWSFVDQYMQNL